MLLGARPPAQPATGREPAGSGSFILSLPRPLQSTGRPLFTEVRQVLRLKPLKTERFFWGALLKGKELPVLEPLNTERFLISFSETPSVWLHYGTRGHRNGLRGLEFGAEPEDSGEVKIISNSCDRRWPASVSCCKHGAPIVSRDHSGKAAVTNFGLRRSSRPQSGHPVWTLLRSAHPALTWSSPLAGKSYAPQFGCAET